MADNLNEWHNPKTVNRYFKSFGFKTDIYSKKDSANLGILWQLRHSIVHTGGTITLPDAQKNQRLSSFGGQAITFQDNFIIALSNKFSEIVKISTKRIEKEFEASLGVSKISKEHKERMEKLFLSE